MIKAPFLYNAVRKCTVMKTIVCNLSVTNLALADAKIDVAVARE